MLKNSLFITFIFLKRRRKMHPKSWPEFDFSNLPKKNFEINRHENWLRNFRLWILHCNFKSSRFHEKMDPQSNKCLYYQIMDSSWMPFNFHRRFGTTKSDSKTSSSKSRNSMWILYSWNGYVNVFEIES